MTESLRQESWRHLLKTKGDAGYSAGIAAPSLLRGYLETLPELSREFLDDAAFDAIPVAPPSKNNPKGSKIGDERWEWPKEWVNSAMRSKRTIDFTVKVDDRGGRLTDPEHAPLLSSVKRYLWAQMAWPVAGHHDIATIQKRAYYALAIAKWVVRFAYPRGKRRLAELEVEDMYALKQHISRNWKSGSSSFYAWQTTLLQINEHGRRGHVQDYFVRIPLHLADDGQATGTLPLQVDPDDIPDADDKPDQDPSDLDASYQPLPDEYVATAGRVWLYYIEHLSPHIIAHMREWLDIREASISWRREKARNGDISDPLASHTLATRISEAYGHFAARYQWTDASGAPIEDLPFPHSYAFPPSSIKDLFVLAGTLQMCAYQLTALCMGGRWGEMRSMTPRSVRETADDPGSGSAVVRGRTFKLSASYAGEPREWPIPREAARGLIAQAALFEPFITGDDPSLWRKTGTNDFGGPMSGMINHHLGQFVQRHRLCPLLGDFPVIHSHRFRKTIARLVVLCLVGAPKILQELFGHRNLNTTLRYILSSPWIRPELQQAVYEEERRLKAQVVSEIDRAGGPGTVVIKESLSRFFSSVGVPTNAKEQRVRMREYVEMTLANGGEIKMILPGIVCIKPMVAAGKCARAGKLPNVAKCQMKCRWHIQLPARRPQVRASIECLISELHDEDVVKNELMASWYRRELKDFIEVFPDLRVEYLARPDVVALLEP